MKKRVFISEDSQDNYNYDYKYKIWRRKKRRWWTVGDFYGWLRDKWADELIEMYYFDDIIENPFIPETLESEYVHYPWLNTHFYFNNTLWLPCTHPKVVFNSLFLYTRCKSYRIESRCQAITRNICDGWNIPYTEKNYSNPCTYGFKR